jgi:hypothetical protein
VRWAASARAVVVLIRGGDNDTSFGGADEGVAVMVVDPAVSWSELAAVVYGLVLEGRETESGRGPTDLFALADSLAEAAGGAVTIEDGLSRVLAYSKLQQHADPARVAPSSAARRRSTCAHSSMSAGFPHIWWPLTIRCSSPGTPNWA